MAAYAIRTQKPPSGEQRRRRRPPRARCRTRPPSPRPPARRSRLSVVIAAYDAADTLGEQLDALVDQEWSGGWEIVVVDNASTDATPDLVRAVAVEHPRVRLVRAVDGRGPAYARNAGARAAAGVALAFCDADDVVAPGWVAAMGAALAEHEFVCGPVELARLNPTWLVGRGEPPAPSRPPSSRTASRSPARATWASTGPASSRCGASTSGSWSARTSTCRCGCTCSASRCSSSPEPPCTTATGRRCGRPSTVRSPTGPPDR